MLDYTNVSGDPHINCTYYDNTLLVVYPDHTDIIRDNGSKYEIGKEIHKIIGYDSEHLFYLDKDGFLFEFTNGITPTTDIIASNVVDIISSRSGPLFLNSSSDVVKLDWNGKQISKYMIENASSICGVSNDNMIWFLDDRGILNSFNCLTHTVAEYYEVISYTINDVFCYVVDHDRKLLFGKNAGGGYGFEKVADFSSYNVDKIINKVDHSGIIILCNNTLYGLDYYDNGSDQISRKSKNITHRDPALYYYNPLRNELFYSQRLVFLFNGISTVDDIFSSECGNIEVNQQTIYIRSGNRLYCYF
ncbi:MAG: hypothetical protein J6N70_03300 [Oribacterium sp.]|nr:hypothetical protein [Oribacterium sp.]